MGKVPGSWSGLDLVWEMVQSRPEDCRNSSQRLITCMSLCKPEAGKKGNLKDMLSTPATDGEWSGRQFVKLAITGYLWRLGPAATTCRFMNSAVASVSQSRQLPCRRAWAQGSYSFSDELGICLLEWVQRAFCCWHTHTLPAKAPSRTISFGRCLVASLQCCCGSLFRQQHA